MIFERYVIAIDCKAGGARACADDLRDLAAMFFRGSRMQTSFVAQRC